LCGSFSWLGSTCVAPVLVTKLRIWERPGRQLLTRASWRWRSLEERAEALVGRRLRARRAAPLRERAAAGARELGQVKAGQEVLVLEAGVVGGGIRMRCMGAAGVSILEAVHFDRDLPMSRLFLSRN
jgi:hypothetical protein